MIELFQSEGTALVVCEYAQTVGIPALFPRSLFPKLMRLKGDSGAKSVILSHKEKLEKVSFPKGIVDVDTPDDLHALPR
jgi:molybdenum cofactor cytidylyltransferase